MRFIVNTKPLQDALSLVVIQANVSKFFNRSTIIQLTVEPEGELVLNSEAEAITSEAHIKGKFDGTESVVAFVDALMLKQLVASFETAVTELQFEEDGVTLHSGKSRFTLPIVDSFGATLLKPSTPYGEGTKINQAIWKDVKSDQMYAISDSYIRPVYTYLYNGDGVIVVGDFDRGLFTVTKKSGLPTVCLLSRSIVSLLLAVEADSKIYQNEEAYVLTSECDSFSYYSEFKPKYEEDPDVGNYSVNLFLELLNSAEKDGIVFNVSAVKKLLSQASLLLDGDSIAIHWEVSGKLLKLVADGIDGVIDVKPIGDKSNYKLTFNLAHLAAVISNAQADDVPVYPIFRDGDVVSCLFESGDVLVILAGVE